MKKCKLGELIKIKHGFAFKSENYVDKSEYALVTLANISNANNFQFFPKKTTYYGSEFPKEYILTEGDLVMPLTEQVIGLFGNSAFIPKIENTTFVLNQRVAKVIVDETKTDRNYIHYLLATETVKDQLEYRASGTKQRNISPEDVYDVEVYVPEIEEQKKIGDFLFTIEKIINNNLEANKKISDFIDLVYSYYFVQYNFLLNGKPYRETGGKFEFNSEIKKRIPLGWEVKKLNTIFDFVNGVEPGSENYITKKEKEYVPFYRVSDVEVKAPLFVNSNYMKNVHVKPDEVLVTFDGSVGKVGVGYDGVYSTGIKKIISKNSDISNSLIYSIFSSEEIKKTIHKYSSGSILKHASDSINHLRIAYNDEVYKRYSLKIDTYYKILIKNIEETEKLEEFKRFVLPLLMSGQIKLI